MSTEDRVEPDPFADPSFAELQPHPVGETTLNVGRNASLTLGTDALIVLDEGFLEQGQGACCGLLPNRSKTTRAIPYFNVLWAELSEFDITVHYARPTSKDVVRVSYFNYMVEKDGKGKAGAWIEQLLDRAYGLSQRRKRIKALINPFGGQGKAPKWYVRDIEPIFAAARCEVDAEKTQYKGHAVEISEKIDVDAFDAIVSCSGDGLPHEVFNGLAKKANAAEALARIAVVQLPCGSGNAMSWSLNGTGSCSVAALCTVKGLRTPLDLVSITQGDRRTLSFLSQSVGIVAEVDLGTDNIRWMGAARFTYGFLVRVLGKTIYPCDLAVKVEIADKSEIKAQYKTEAARKGPMLDRSRSSPAGGLPLLRYGTVKDELPSGWELIPYDNLGNFYSGNMNYMTADFKFFPAALPADGCQDLVTIDGDISRVASIKSLLAVEKGTFFDMAHVKVRKISAYRIIPKNQKDGYISIDGESVPFEPFQAEVHRGLGTVLSKTGHMYEGKGVA